MHLCWHSRRRCRLGPASTSTCEGRTRHRRRARVGRRCTLRFGGIIDSPVPNVLHYGLADRTVLRSEASHGLLHDLLISLAHCLRRLSQAQDRPRSQTPANQDHQGSDGIHCSWVAGALSSVITVLLLATSGSAVVARRIRLALITSSAIVRGSVRDTESSSESGFKTGVRRSKKVDTQVDSKHAAARYRVDFAWWHDGRMDARDDIGLVRIRVLAECPRGSV